MKIVNIPNCTEKIKNKVESMIKLHLGSADEKAVDHGYVFLDSNNILGYCLLIPEKNHVKIDWIYATKKGYGTEFLSRVERSIFRKYDRIILNVSVDPNESKQKVMRRVNFYIKNNYRVYDIKFRKKYGPLMMMEKCK